MPELIASIINVEINAKGMAERKGILSKIDKSIRTCFYKNEADATQFYSGKTNRQKNVGGKYNEKFLEVYSPGKSLSENNSSSNEDVDA